MNTSVSSGQAVLIFFAFFGVLIAFALLKKAFYYFRLKKRYYIVPRPSIKGIANIAMVSALSVAVLVLLTLISANAFSVLFRAFPGSRVTIEGILIKIGGLLFGPFIGLFIGAITDLLTIITTAGIFHYGYFIGAMGYGLLSGLVKSIFTYSKKTNNLIYAFIATFLLLVIGSSAIGFVVNFIDDGNGIVQTILPNFFVSSQISRDHIIYVIIGFCSFFVIVVWTLLGSSYFFKEKVNEGYINNKKSLYTTHIRRFRKKFKIKRKFFIDFCLVLVCCAASELLINVILLPSFDADLSTLGYDNWFLIRILFFAPSLAFNLIIIYPVYTIVAPLVKWDYKLDSIEDAKKSYFVN